MAVNAEAGRATARRERKSDRTRRRILDAAADVLSRKGFDGVRLADIADLAQMRLPNIYYYFDSREALLEEVVNIGGRLAHENVEARLAGLAPAATAMDRLCTAVAAHLEMVLKEAAYTAAAMRTMNQLPPDIRERQLRDQRAHGELWHNLIIAAADSGELDPDLDPRAARMFLLGAVNWAAEWWSPAHGSIEDITATAERFVRNALTGPIRGQDSSTTAVPPRGALIPQFAPPPE